MGRILFGATLLLLIGEIKICFLSPIISIIINKPDRYEPQHQNYLIALLILLALGVILFSIAYGLLSNTQSLKTEKTALEKWSMILSATSILIPLKLLIFMSIRMFT